MKKIVSIFVAALVFSAVGLSAMTTTTVAAAPYDKEATKGAMKEFLGVLGKLNPAIEAGDFYTVADEFFALAKIGQKIAKTKAPKGSDAEWTKVWDSFIAASFKGVGAAGEKDVAKVKKALEEVFAANKKGHTLFK